MSLFVVSFFCVDGTEALILHTVPRATNCWTWLDVLLL